MLIVMQRWNKTDYLLAFIMKNLIQKRALSCLLWQLTSGMQARYGSDTLLPIIQFCALHPWSLHFCKRIATPMKCSKKIYYCLARLLMTAAISHYITQLMWVWRHQKISSQRFQRRERVSLKAFPSVASSASPPSIKWPLQSCAVFSSPDCRSQTPLPSILGTDT